MPNDQTTTASQTRRLDEMTDEEIDQLEVALRAVAQDGPVRTSALKAIENERKRRRARLN